MKNKLKEFFIGQTLEDSKLQGEKFSVLWGIPVFASDAISSVSYAGEEILLVLLPVLSMTSYKYFLPIVAAIICLLAILVFCYRQTIDAYPDGGGAYIVASENLGENVGLFAGASLIMDYVLTVAVSSCASAAAVASAFPAAFPYKAFIAFGLIVLLTWGNLRGLRDSAVMFGVPTYMFIATMIIMLITGTVKFISGAYTPADMIATTEVATDSIVFIILKAFASGCTALTGVEAVSNGVPNFAEPRQKHAKTVLLAMAGFVCLIFFGVSALTSAYKIVPTEEATAVSQLAAAIFGRNNVMFYVVQIMTVVILALAANTAYADVPVLMAIIAKRGYLPRQLVTRGARLNYSNGIIFLFVTASILVFVFNGNQHHLLPLYASGVFISFTLSQLGMFIHWLRHKEDPSWKFKAVVNAIGTVICSFVLVVIIIMKFVAGAWVSLLCILTLLLIMRGIKKHYEKVEKDISIDLDEARTLTSVVKPSKLILPVQSINRSFIKALDLALSLGYEQIELFCVAAKEEQALKLKAEIDSLNNPKINYVYQVTELRNVSEIILNHVEAEANLLEEHQSLIVMMSSISVKNKLCKFLHNDTTESLSRQLLKNHKVSILKVPYIV